MKFGRRLQEEAFEEFKPHYIAYKELKKAIKLITGTDTSQFTISEVTSNFGNIPALAGSTYRPPESRFQDLLNFEVQKINKFSALIYSSISSNLQAALKPLYYGEIETLDRLNQIREATEISADGVAYLHSYIRLNFVGFRKITKKYDKHNKSASSGFYLARLVKEPFVNFNFDFLIELISVVFSEMRRVKRMLLSQAALSPTTGQLEQPTEDPTTRRRSAIGYEEDDVDIDDDDLVADHVAADADMVSNHTTECRSTAHRTLSVSTSSSSDRMIDRTYFVGESDLMRVRVHLSKHIPLTSLGGVICPKPSSDLVKGFVDGIPQHHQHGSTFVTIEGSPAAEARSVITSTPSASLLKYGSTRLDSNQHLVNPAVYRFEQTRVSSGCLYFDNERLEKYRELNSTQVDESPNEVLRLRWESILADGSTSSSDPMHDAVVLEIAPGFQPARSPNEWHDIRVSNENENLPLNTIVLRRSHIPRLLDGTLTLGSVVNGSLLPAERLGQLHAVMTHALALVEQKNYRPVFQEWLHRSHFRKTGQRVKRHVFAHLDESIRMTDAVKAYHRDSTLASSFSAVSHLAPDKDGCTFGYGVLTISFIADRKLKFLPKITGLPSVHEVQRYAPHLHGVSLFRRRQLKDDELPSWFQFVVADVDEGSKSSGESPKVMKELVGGAGSTRHKNHGSVDVVSTKPGSRLFHEHVMTVQQQQQDVSTGEERGDVIGSRLQSTPDRLVRPPPGFSMFNPLPASICSMKQEATNNLQPEEPVHYRLGFTPPRIASSARTPLLIGPSDLPPPPPRDHFLIQCFQTILSMCPNFRSLSGLSGGSSPPAFVGSAAVRVEPKTFFANERTLLQWMNTAVLLSTISITLLNFGTSTGRLAGLIMAPVALFFIIYSFSVYIRRSYSLERKEPINYNDRLGPALLVCCLICALSAIIVLNIVYGPSDDLLSSSSPSSTSSPTRASSPASAETLITQFVSSSLTDRPDFPSAPDFLAKEI